jgi:hypothetical protein
MARVSLYLNDLLRGRLWRRAMRRFSGDRQTIFTSIYKARYWNPDGKGESASGEGSTIAATDNARAAIEAVVREFSIKSMIDVPCGDFNWMRYTKLHGVKYTGGDIVRPLVERNNREFGSPERNFIHLDIVEQVCQPYDLILCRDCIQHLPNAEVQRILKNFSESGSKWLLVTMSPAMTRNDDMPKAGGFRAINLYLPPFNLPKPERVYVDWEDLQDPTCQKHLGLWRLPLSIERA